MEPGQLIWDEPPPPTARQLNRGIYAALANQLREYPKRWARIYLGKQGTASTRAYTISHGTHAGFREGRWEAVARKLGDDWVVYARYLGDDEET